MTATTSHLPMASLTGRQRLVVELRFVDELDQGRICRDEIRRNAVRAS